MGWLAAPLALTCCRSGCFRFAWRGILILAGEIGVAFICECTRLTVRAAKKSKQNGLSRTDGVWQKHHPPLAAGLLLAVVPKMQCEREEIQVGLQRKE